MIQPLQLKNTLLPVNVIQGPLAGVTCAPFRLLTWRYSQPAYSYTEMISCKTLLHKNAPKRYIYKDPQEGPVCFQLAASNPQDVAEAAKRVTDYGADVIDLNCGCPVKKIRSKGAGSSLLTQPSQLYRLILSLKQNTHLPISIKIRVAHNGDDKSNQEIAKVVSEAGADCLVVHGRSVTERYDTPCRYEAIRYFVHSLSIPVIGNGDITDGVSLKKMLATGCAGVMIARAGLGQPWLIGQLIAEYHQQKFVLPAIPEIGQLFIEHIEKLAILLDQEKFAVLQARRMAKYYARRLKDKIEFCQAVNACETLDSFKIICKHYFSRPWMD